MSVNTINPLVKHFRQPAIYFKLPSQGNFWPEGSLELPMTGEIPVYPMTAKDEITLRTPDALLNGQGVVDVIQSCCPNIKDAWAMPSTDVDPVLIAIRIASYGPDMDFDIQCPHCNHDHSVSVALSTVLEKFVPGDYTKKINTNDIIIKLKPHAYFSINKRNQISFEEQRILDAIASSELTDEEKTTEYNKHLARIVDLNVEMLVNSTDYIETPDGAVVNRSDFIKEFYINCASEIVHAVQKNLDDLLETSGLAPQVGSCPSCEKEYTVPITFDYANFFGNGS